MAKNKARPKPTSAVPPQIVGNTSAATDLSSEAQQQFEVELYWCIQQLQAALNSGKLNPKQVQDSTKTLNTLMSKSAPLVKKRQVMKLTFGDYRSKMAAEEKRLRKVNQQVKLSPAKPNLKSVFVKRSTSTTSSNPKSNAEEPNHAKDIVQNTNGLTENMFSSDNSFRFDFNVPPHNTGEDNEQMEVDIKQNENKHVNINNTFHFVPSNNNFKFSFNIDN